MNPRIAMAVIGAWLISLAAMGYWQNRAGHIAERGEWQARETSELRMANREIERLNGEARAKERQHAENMSSIATSYEKEMQNEKRKTDVLVADLLAGSLVLHDPAGQSPGASETGATPASTGERDGETGCQLSTAAARFLLEEAGRADAIVEQLTACQQVVVSDRL